MTEQGKPLSRRDRRAMEARAAATNPDATESLESAGDHPSPPTDGLSRRDRRRIERSQQPMETWTAEEEMIATGQLPAMTPEVIAQQEQIAKKKAAEAAADAAAAAAALGLAHGDDAPPAPADTDASTPPVRASAFGRVADAGTEPDDTASGDDVPEGRPAEVGGSDDSATDDSASGDSTSEDGDTGSDVPLEDAPHIDESAMAATDDTDAEMVPPEAGTTDGSESEHQPADESDDGADAEPSNETVAESDVAPHEDSDVASEVDGGEPDLATEQPLPGDDDGIPAAFRGMFPPGSLQARVMAARREEAAQAAAAPAARASSASSSDSLEEFRRLTAEAMAGIEGSAARAEAQAEPTDPQPEWGAPSEHAADDSSADAELDGSGDKIDAEDGESGVDADDVATEQNPWHAAPVLAATTSPPAGDVADARELDESPAETDAEPSTSSDGESLDADADAMPPKASFDDLIAAPEGEVPLAEQTVDPKAALPQASDENPTVEPSIWDSHPLNDTNATARELADAPSQAIPQPDFSKLAPATNPEHPAPFSPTAYTGGEPPLTTGSIEVARRKVPELHPAGGARHFRWAHIAVIGAIAFVLGVLVWNLAGQGS